VDGGDSLTPQPAASSIPIKSKTGSDLEVTGQLYRKQKTAFRRF
jgi:hypothetical protein